MNRVYRIIWSVRLFGWVVTSELGHARKKSSKQTRMVRRGRRALSRCGAIMSVGLMGLSSSLLSSPVYGHSLPSLSVLGEHQIGVGVTESYPNEALQALSGIRLDGTLNLGGKGVFQNSLSGSESGRLNITQDAHIIFDRSHDAYKGQYQIDTRGKLTIRDLQALGFDNTAVVEGDLLMVQLTGQIHNKFEGQGTIRLVGSDLILAGYTGGMTSFSGMLDIDQNSIYRFNRDTNTFTLHHNIRGAGIFQVDIEPSNLFNFTWDMKGDEFNGTLQLTSGTIDFNTDHMTYLNKLPNATLEVGASGTVNVHSGLTQSSKGLTLDGGTINFTAQTSGFETLKIKEHIHVKKGVSTIKVNGADFKTDTLPSGNFFDQQQGALAGMIIQGKTASKETGAEIHLEDEKGNPISEKEATKTALADNAGFAYYSAGQGLIITDGKEGENGIGYGATLTSLEANQNHSILISNHKDNENQAKKFKVLLTGEGGFTFKSEDQITLYRDAHERPNDYRGVTTLTSGKLNLQSDQVLGRTSNIILNHNTELDLNHIAQTAGGLNTATGSLLNLNEGHLSLIGDGIIEGFLTGSDKSHLTIADGERLSIKQLDNHPFKGTLVVNQDATLALYGVASIGGFGKVNLKQGTLLFTEEAKGVFGNEIITTKDDKTALIKLDKQADIHFTGDRSTYAGRFALEDESRLTITHAYALGNHEYNQVTIGKEATLALNGFSHQLNNAIVGEGAIDLNDQASIGIKGDYSGYTGRLSVDENSEFIIDKMGSYTLHHGLGGAGTVSVTLDSRDHQFTLDQADMSGFSGNLILNQGTMALDLDHQAKLKGAELTFKKGSIGIVQTSDENDRWNVLNLAGGTLQFKGNSFDPLYVESLHVMSGSELMIDDLEAIKGQESLDDIDRSISFFDQQKGVIGAEFVEANQLTDKSHGSSITLVNKEGQLIESGLEARHELEGGVAIYDYKGIVESKEGEGGLIALTYGLTELEAKKDHFLTLKNDAEGNTKLGVILSGDGGFTFDITPSNKEHPVEVGNAKSSYMGETHIKGSEVRATTDNAFGRTSYLNLEDGSHVTFVGEKRQEIGVLSISNSAKLSLSESNLIIRNGGTIDGSITSDKNGQLTVAGGELTLSNGNEDYAGTTRIAQGAGVVLKNHHALGKSSEGKSAGVIWNEGRLTLAGEGRFDNRLMGSKTASVTVSGDDTLFTANNSDYYGTILIENNKTLIAEHEAALGRGDVQLTDHATLTYRNVSGDNQQDIAVIGTQISGTQSSYLNVENSALYLQGDNNGFEGALVIDDLSRVTMDQFGLISGNINNEGALTFDINEGVKTYRGQLTGRGIFTKSGGGTLAFEQSQHYSGDIEIKQGALRIDSGITYQTDATLYIDQEGMLTLLDQSFVSANSVKNNGVIGGYGTLQGNLNNNGKLQIGSRINAQGDNQPDANQFTPGVFTIKGDYFGGKGSTIHFGTIYGNDQSPTDQLVIEGKATGESQVVVDNIHGLGAPTNRGIELIRIDDGDHSDIELIHKGRTVGGAYEYRLVELEKGHWYLTNHIEDEVLPPDVDPTTPQFRSETGAYIGNLASANRLFNHGLHDRQYITPESSLWTRTNANFGTFRDSSNQAKITQDYYAFQVGCDVIKGVFGDQPFTFGLMGGYGYTESKSRNEVTGYQSKGRGDAYAIGIYGTLGEDHYRYVDGWLQYIYMDSTIKSAGIDNESYKVKGFIASIEAGYAFELSQNLHLQPQLQLTWMGAKMDDMTDGSGTKIRGSKDNIETRLGVRLFADKALANGGSVRPYMDLNYIHYSKPFAAEFDGVRVEQKGTRNLGEVKVGLEADVNDNLKVWGDVGFRKGSNSYRDTKISAGIRYEF